MWIAPVGKENEQGGMLEQRQGEQHIGLYSNDFSASQFLHLQMWDSSYLLWRVIRKIKQNTICAAWQNIIN